MSRARSVVFFCLLTVGALAAEGVEKFDFVRITPAEVRWHDIPGGLGAQQAILQGDPDKPGIYVARVKFPPHVMDLPHWHPHARYVTVLQGTWYAGTGTVLVERDLGSQCAGVRNAAVVAGRAIQKGAENGKD